MPLPQRFSRERSVVPLCRRWTPSSADKYPPADRRSPAGRSESAGAHRHGAVPLLLHVHRRFQSRRVSVGPAAAADCPRHKRDDPAPDRHTAVRCFPAGHGYNFLLRLQDGAAEPAVGRGCAFPGQPAALRTVAPCAERGCPFWGTFCPAVEGRWPAGAADSARPEDARSDGHEEPRHSRIVKTSPCLSGAAPPRGIAVRAPVYTPPGTALRD